VTFLPLSEACDARWNIISIQCRYSVVGMVGDVVLIFTAERAAGSGACDRGPLQRWDRKTTICHCDTNQPLSSAATSRDLNRENITPRDRTRYVITSLHVHVQSNINEISRLYTNDKLQ